MLALAYATPYIPVRLWGWLSLLALAYPFLLLANAGFVVFWFLLGQRAAWLSAVMLTVGWPVHTRYLKFFALPAPRACEKAIVCAAYNVRGFSLVKAPPKSRMEEKVDTLFRAFKTSDALPDILCLEEAIKAEPFAKRFRLPYVYHAPRSTLWLFSRYPIRDKGSLDGAETTPCALWADLETPQGTVRIYNIHLVSNRVTNTTRELIDDFDNPGSNRWENFKFIITRYRRTTIERAREAELLRAHMASCPHPVLIVGDANDTPLSRTFRILSRGLQDSFRQRGSGLSTTYGSLLPLLRIDYQLGSDDVQFLDHRIPDIQHSDHLPVVTAFCLRPASGS